MGNFPLLPPENAVREAVLPFDLRMFRQIAGRILKYNLFRRVRQLLAKLHFGKSDQNPEI